MTVLKYKLCFLLLTLAPEVWTKMFECGEHGKFEYCIDEIPGCVVGCYCYPGYYFDTDSKICEPNSNLFTRRKSSSRNTRRKGKLNKSKQRASSAEKRVTQEFQALASDASDLTDWLYKTFFSEVEKEAEKQSKKKYKRPNSNKKSRPSKKKKIGYFKKIKKYFRTSSAEANADVQEIDKSISGEKSTNLNGEIEPEKTASDDEAGSAKEAGSDEGASASDKNNPSAEEAEEIEKNASNEMHSKDTSDDNDDEHNHKYVLLMKKSRPETTTAIPLLPSFIFLPNVETPFYPPLGLPVPPVMPMYPAVPVPPVAVAPNFAVPVQPSAVDANACPHCHEIIVYKNIVETTTLAEKRKEHTTPTPKPTTETSIETSTDTIFDLQTNTVLSSTVKIGTMNTAEKSDSNTTFKSTTKTLSITETTEKRSPEFTLQPSEWKGNYQNQTSTTINPKEINFNSSLGPTLNNTTKTEINSATDTILLPTTKTENSISTSSTLNGSHVPHDAHRRAQGVYYDLNDFLEDLNSLFNRKKELKNQRIKMLLLNDYIKKNESFRDKLWRWVQHNFKDKSLLLKDIPNNPLHTLNLSQTVLGPDVVDDKELSDASNIDFKYISDLIHKPEFKNNVIDTNSHVVNKIKEHNTNHAQAQGFASSMKDVQNSYYSNLGRQIASLIRNSETDQGRIQHEDRVKKLKDYPAYLTERNLEPPITSLNNAKYAWESNYSLLNLENKVKSTTSKLPKLQNRANIFNLVERDRHNEKVQEINMTPNIVNPLHNSKTVQWPQQNENYIINNKPHEQTIHENNIGDRWSNSEIPFWSDVNDKLQYIANSHKPSLNNKEQYHTVNPKSEHNLHSIKGGAKNNFIINQKPLGLAFSSRSTRRPERSYIGRTFFSGDIM